MSLVGPDTQILQAGLARFASSGILNRIKGNVPLPVRRVLDVGACIGYYTMLFHEAWPEAEIWAVEPSSLNFRYLMANTGHIANVRHLPLAAGEATYTHTIAMPTQEEKTFLNFPEGNSGEMTLFGSSNIYREEVPVVRLDDLIDWCDFIKIDTEGYEDRVIRGASRLLKEARPTLFVEFVPENRKLAGVTAEELANLIQSYDYAPTHGLAQDIIFLPKEKIHV